MSESSVPLRFWVRPESEISQCSAREGHTVAKRLPRKLDAEVARLFDEAEAVFDQLESERALVLYRAAWALIPEPKGHWQRAVQVLGGIVDCQFHLCDYEDCFKTLQVALWMDGGGPENPWIRLRLGQCYVVRGDERAACDWLLSAFVFGGPKMFENEEDGYGCRDFLMEPVARPRVAGPRGGSRRPNRPLHRTGGARRFFITRCSLNPAGR
jgi:hypothetical protein